MGNAHYIPLGIDYYSSIFETRETATSNQTIYIDSVNGSDDSGTGDISSPYETIEKFLSVVPVRSQYNYTCKLKAGSYDLPNDINLLSQNDNITFDADWSVDSSYSVNSTITNTKDTGIEFDVSGTPFTGLDLVGNIIKFTSGSLINRFGLIKSHTNNSMKITVDTSSFIALSAGDAFSLYNYDVTINLPSSSNCSVVNSILQFSKCKIVGTNTFATQMSSLYFLECYCNFKKINIGHSCIVRLNRSYFKPNGTPDYIVTSAEQCTLLLERGSILDGNSSFGIRIGNNCNIRVDREVCIQNINSDGLTTRYSNITCDNDDSILRFEGWAGSIRDRQDGAGGHTFIRIPYLRGDTTADYLLLADDGTTAIFDDASVTTNLGTNTCSVDGGTTEGYFDAAKGTMIIGLTDSDSILSNLQFNLQSESPTQITSNQDNYEIGNNPIIRLSSDASRNITGIKAISNRRAYIVNAGSNDITLKHEDANSDAVNRIINGMASDIIMTANMVAGIWYDDTTQRWRLF